jgi:histidine triad (HIT) family protein
MKGQMHMSEDFYCEEVLSGRTPVQKVVETDNILAYHHTRPFYPVHIVAIPKRHIPSLLALEPADNDLLLELMRVVKQAAAQVVAEHGACRVITNMGNYQDSKHLHFHVVFGQPLVNKGKNAD